jgi:capsular polysaccharide biosynthesis protein
MTFDIRLRYLRDILTNEHAVSEAGVRNVLELVPGGSYERRSSPIVDFTDIDDDIRGRAEQAFAKTTQTYRPLLEVHLGDAIVTGPGAVITANHLLLHESVAEPLSYYGEVMGLERAEDGAFRLPRRPDRRIDGPALLLKPPFYRNFGHWLIECAALLALLAERSFQAELTIVTGPQRLDGMRAIQRETFELLAPGVPVIEMPDAETWSFSSLFYHTPIHFPPLFKLPAGLDALRNRILQTATPRAERRKLFVRRIPLYPRRIENEPAVIELCSSLGFEIIDPECFSLAEQAALFQAADEVVGLKGAALTNIIFCEQGSGVTVLSPGDFDDPFFWDLAAQRGLTYRELYGKVAARNYDPSLNSCVIDIERLARILIDPRGT